MWGSEGTSFGLSSSGLSNYKWDSVSPSAHKHKNHCQTTLSFSLSFPSSFPTDYWSTAPPTVRVKFISLSFSIDVTETFQKTTTTRFTGESPGCGVFCICAEHLCSDSSWFLPQCLFCYCPDPPDSLRKLSRCWSSKKRRRKWKQFLANAALLLLFICLFMLFGRLWGVYWPKADSLRLPRVPAGSLDWCPSLIVFRSDAHLIKTALFISFINLSLFLGNHMYILAPLTWK